MQPTLDDIRAFLAFRQKLNPFATAREAFPLLDAIGERAKADPAYAAKLDRWLGDDPEASTVFLRDEIAGIFRDAPWAQPRTGNPYPFENMWTAMDSARLHVDDFIGHVLHVEDGGRIALAGRGNLSAAVAGSFVAEIANQVGGLYSEERRRMSLFILGRVRDGAPARLDLDQVEELAGLPKTGMIVTIAQDRVGIDLPDGQTIDLAALSSYLYIDVEFADDPVPQEDMDPSP